MGKSGETEGPRDQAALFAFATALAALAGFVDATGFIHFHLFASFMSGNSTQAMVALAHGDAPRLVLFARTILLFVVGVALGESVASVSARWGRAVVLCVEAALLGATLAALRLGWGEVWTTSALALAMGNQNAAVHRAEGISVALTYVTGTLVHVGRGVAAALRGAARWRDVLPFLVLWVGLACGGCAGAAAASHSLILALEIAIGVAVALLLVALVAAFVSKPAPD